MNTAVCSNCLNQEIVNETTNRLVTESCGHVKCMNCLLQERDGCQACAKEAASQKIELIIEKTPHEDSPPRDQSEDIVIEVPRDQSRDIVIEVPVHVYEKHNGKKKKLETKHVTVEIDANGRSYYCTVCKRHFQARTQVAYHAYCNGQSKPYECPVPECNKSFATQSHFKYHMRVHRNERTYACDVCGDSFFQMSKLQRHKLKHTKEKKFACASCGKAFSNQTALRAHALIHAQLKPHGCELCGLRFRDRSNFTKHMHKHRGSGCDSSRPQRGRAFQCPRCPQAFRSRKDMRRHSAVHSDSKPYRCRVCDRRFRRKDNLDRHIRNTHRDHAPDTAADLDHSALSDLLTTMNHVDTAATTQSEKTKLEMLNPLPPLSQDLLNKHMHSDGHPESSYIIEANNKRESVIFGPIRSDFSTKKEANEYVHKKKKFNTWNQKVSEENEVSLPPIDNSKLMRIYDTFDSPDKFEKLKEENYEKPSMEVLPPKNIEVYKNILNPERPEAKDISIVTGEQENGAGQNSGISPQVHWRRKIALNINW